MGKQNRRKKHEKKEQNKRQQERGETANTANQGQRDEGEQVENGDNMDWAIEVGDRVWWKYDDTSSGWSRGIVRAMDDLLYTISRTDVADRADLYIHVPRWCVKYDPFPCWTLRFRLGDKVVCNSGSWKGKSGSWKAATVEALWPNGQRGYSCRETTVSGHTDILVWDRDTDIVKHPMSFRFSKGDEVIFSSAKAKATGLMKTNLEPWIRGKITRVDIVGLKDNYAVYECSFMDRNQTKKCFILQDNDSHVVRLGVSPRQRLLDSIEQNCDAAHMHYLVHTFHMDLKAFRDLLVARATESGNYHALALLKDEASVDFDRIRDAEGNGLLHQIVRTPNAEPFFEMAAIEFSKIKDFKEVCLLNDLEPNFFFIELDNAMSNKKDRLIRQKNNKGRTWLHELVASRNSRALDLALSPDGGLAWQISSWLIDEATSIRSSLKDNDGVTLTKAARRLGEFEMEKMIDEFSEWHRMHKLSCELESDKLKLTRESDPSLARRFIRFCRQWGRFRPGSDLTIESIIKTLCLRGNEHALSWLLDADPSLLRAEFKMKVARANRNEFAQPELYDDDSEEQEEDLNLVSLAILGQHSFHSPIWQLKKAGMICSFRSYANKLAEYAELQITEKIGAKYDLVSFINDEISMNPSDDALVAALEYKNCLLQDDKSLENRLNVLHSLYERGQAPSNALDVIRWRQCGVLRNLVEEGFVDLEGEVRREKELIRCGLNKEFMGRGVRNPDFSSMTVRVFLCLAAIEFDDLQSLQWLVNDEIPLMRIRFDGWNAVHYCAYFGRSEIFLWLRSENMSQLLIEEMCTREHWGGLYAAHLAVKRGFTFLSGLLVSSGCPSQDSEGRSVSFHAKNSELEFVREWGIVYEKPMLLEKDIQELLQLLSSKGVDDIKGHICATDCLSTKRWIECDFLANKSGPLGKSYLEVLDECGNVVDPDFIVWLCRELSPSSRHDFNEKVSEWDLLLGSEAVSGCREKANHVDVAAIKSFAVERKDDFFLRRCLNKAWTKNICCSEPSEENVVLGRFLRNSRENAVSTALELFRDELLRVDALRNVQLASLRELERMFARGAKSEEISETIEIAIEAATEQAEQEGRELQLYFEKRCIISSDRKINLDYKLPCRYSDEHDLQAMVEWFDKSASELSYLYAVLAIECSDELIAWSRDPNRSTWDAAKEIAVVRIAAHLGHTKVVNIFLRKSVHEEFHSLRRSRFYAAILGAAEAGKVSDLSQYLDECKKLDLPSDPIVNDCEAISFAIGIEDRRNRRNAVASSLIGCVVFGCLYGQAQLSVQACEGRMGDGHREVLKLVVLHSLADVESCVRAAALILRDINKIFSYERCIDLLLYLIADLDLDVFHCQEDINRISEQFVHYMISESHKKKATNLLRLQALLKGWLNLISDLGFDIQSLKFDPFGHERRKSLASVLVACQAEQCRAWSQFDLIKRKGSLDEIKRSVRNGDIRLTVRYENGLLFTHLAAAYDRLDVLQWLVEEKGMSLNSCDASGRTVADVAGASDASSIIRWISREKARKTISTFASSHFRRRLYLKKYLRLRRCICTIQAWQRGNAIRRLYRGRLASHLEDRLRFHEIWDRSIFMVASTSSLYADYTWAAIKQQEHDTVRVEDVVEDMEMFAETTQKLGKAAASALTAASQCDEHLSVIEPEDNSVDPEQSNTEEQAQSQEWQCVGNLIRIKFTSDVVKWLRRGDSKYREFFVRRIEQLASGQRSRILKKRLTGCKTPIYEVYLEQKSGYRILWTEGKDQSLLIWYVAKHKDVSRLIGLIDDAESRSSRQLTPATVISSWEGSGEEKIAKEERILLDPLGDTPLKLYEVRPDEIEKLIDPSWKPRLYLTTKEREVVETGGTVLLLGRSGTGKTCIICNRMDYDRQRAGADLGFKQLFIARSQRLCDYVRGAVGMSSPNEDDEKVMQFETYAQIIWSLESHLSPVSDNAAGLFLNSRKMDFRRFKREVYRSDSSGGLDALIIWTNIRSFIKGSIEAILRSNRVLPEEEYFGLGKRRCRLSREQRQGVYVMFERYNKCIKELGLWDDCDRIAALFSMLESARASDPVAYQNVRYSKVYVDEVQDYTQAEIAVFFYLCGPGDLFLAGDPAQSVVEGVEFRFEEIRSVGYRLYGKERQHLIPDKPRTVHLNFRSHCGILNVAAAVLSCLFEIFPDSAKQLKEDRGLFHGPRPGVFNKVEVERLKELVFRREGIVVLTHDHEVPRWKRALDYPLVYGIREAKGLEFQEVILVDFFGGVPESLQKSWRNLLLGRDVADISGRPEVEGHLKLLYTAITRCIQRLFFAETASSLAGDAFVRWLTTTTVRTSTSEAKAGKEALAVKSSVDNVEKMIRTPDEWRSAGLDNAVMAEASEDLSESESWLEKAIYCFEQIGDTALASKARTHRSGVRFRLNLEETAGSDSEIVNVTQIESDAALLTEELLAEHLVLEAREVCGSILSLFSANYRDMLEEAFVSLLPGVEDVELSRR